MVRVTIPFRLQTLSSFIGLVLYYSPDSVFAVHPTSVTSSAHDYPSGHKFTETYMHNGRESSPGPEKGRPIVSENKSNGTEVDPCREKKRHRYCNDTSELNPFNNANNSCSCLRDCHRYEDCCWKAPVTASRQEKTKKLQTTCEMVYLEEYKKFTSISMVSSCPTDLRDEKKAVLKMCEQKQTVENRTDDILLIPVTSVITNITYRNLYCAYCNNDFEDGGIIFWNGTLENQTEDAANVSSATEPGRDAVTTSSSTCGYESTGKCPKQILAVASQEEGKFLKLSVNYRVISVLHGCLMYKTPIVDSCPEETPERVKRWNDTQWKELKYNCSLYHEPLSERLGNSRTTYKNKFCYLCSNMNATAWTKELQGRFRCNNVKIFYNIEGQSSCGGTLDSCKRGGYVPLIQNVHPFGNDYCAVKKEKGCRMIKCGKYFERGTDGNCYRRTNPTNGRPGRLIDRCPLVVSFTPGEYTKDDGENATDGAVYVILVSLYNGKRVKPGEYDVENGSLTVCAHVVNQYNMFDGVAGNLAIVGTSLSVIALVFKIVLHFLDQEVKNIASKLVAYLSISLLVAQFLFLTISNRVEWKNVCAAGGVLMHYAYLASFFWMNVVAFDLCRTFYRTSGPNRTMPSTKKLFRYSVYAWGLPFTIVSASVVLEWIVPDTLMKPYYGAEACWISGRYASFAFFGVPLLVVLMANIVLFVLTVAKITNSFKSTNMAHENTGRKRNSIQAILYVKLALIMGITWVFAFLIPFVYNDILQYMFILLNSSQGLFILLSFTRFRISMRKISTSTVSVFVVSLRDRAFKSAASSSSSSTRNPAPAVSPFGNAPYITHM